MKNLLCISQWLLVFLLGMVETPCFHHWLWSYFPAVAPVTR